MQPSEALQKRGTDVVAVLRDEKRPKDVFGPTFLAAVPPDQFKAVSARFIGQHGPAIGVEELAPTGNFSARIAIRFQNAIGRGMISLSPTAPHRIEGLLFQQFDPVDDSLEKIKADLAALPGQVGVYYGDFYGENAVLTMNEDEQFAIGSAFKLYVLAALDQAIADEQHQWEQTWTLDSRSFPSGILQEWPDGSPITLHTLATLMISISDNTATDQLLSVLGRSRIEQFLKETGHSAPERNSPFLFTHELFIIKGEGIGDDYLALSHEEKDNWLVEISGSSISEQTVAAAFSGKPMNIDTIEWFASPRDLVRLFAQMEPYAGKEAFRIMAINPAMPDDLRAKWNYVGYKGGSEPGVLNLTWLLQDKGQRWHVLTLSWNNPNAPLDNAALEQIARRILSLPG